MQIPRTIALRILAGFAVVASAALATTPAYAGDVAAAEALFRDGQKLLKEGQFAAACDRFTESQAQDPSTGTLIALALCHEKQGKTASAWAEYTLAASQAERAGNQRDRAQYAKDGALRVEPQLHKLVISIKFPVDGIEVVRDTISVGKGQWGAEVPVDMGDHVIEVTAKGKKKWSTKIAIAAGPGRETVEVPALQDAPPDLVPGTPAPGKASADGRDTGTSGGTDMKKAVGLALGGIGLASLGTGVGFYIVGIGQQKKADDASARAGVMTPPDSNLAGDRQIAKNDGDAADQDKLIGYVAGGAGLALIVTGVVLLVLPSGSSAQKTASSLHIFPTTSPHGGGLTVLGEF